ncbi:MAG: signal peptide peptidase SppA [Phycisphaerae bacterium]|nr:signal peptide peptidase SppA [Phycisphaerae bacterium]
MKRQSVVWVMVLAGFVLAGCGQRSAWIIRPVSPDEKLTESVVSRDPGLFVGAKIAIIDVDGLLLNSRRQSIFSAGENQVSLFVEKLDKAQRDPNVKAMIIRINSPGGGVTACDIMHDRLRRFRDARRDVRVFAVIEDVGASGAYYVACGAERILAHPTSVVGSIGVIVQTVSFAGTMAKLGIDAHAITSGKHKDLASPLKPLDKEDQAILQEMVDRYYKRFLKVVGAGRKALPAVRVKALADGRVFAGEQAKELGLVDGLMHMTEAIQLAKQECGAKRVKVVIYHRPWGHRANVYSTLPTPPQINLINISVGDFLDMARPRFMYLWTGRR